MVIKIMSIDFKQLFYSIIKNLSRKIPVLNVLGTLNASLFFSDLRLALIHIIHILYPTVNNFKYDYYQTMAILF